MSIWNWAHYAIVEAIEPFKLHPTSKSYIYKVFEHLKQLWMGIWQHTHTVTTTAVSPDIWKSSMKSYDVNVEMIPLRYRWGYRTFQTASHIHVIYMLIPKWEQTPYGYGESPNAKFFVSLPLSIRGLPIWLRGLCFWHPFSHALKNIFFAEASHFLVHTEQTYHTTIIHPLPSPSLLPPPQ